MVIDMMTAEQLKNSILQLAMQGKLVEQRLGEGTGEELFKEIQVEKKKLIKEKKYKVPKPQEDLAESVLPFDIPDNWRWCQVGDFFSNASGLSYKKGMLSETSTKMVRILRGGNIGTEEYFFREDDKFIKKEYVDDALYLKKGYMITPAVTSLNHIGKIGLIEKDYTDVVAGGFVLMLMPYFDNDTISRFLLYWFDTKEHRDACRGITHKSGQAFYNLSREKLMNLPVPLPPLAEQKRIVAKIRELMPFVDQYATASTKLNTLNTTFPEMMKKSILQEAVQGRLVPQDPNDEPASVLLKKITEEKKRLIKEGKIKKEKEVDLPIPEELPFELPESWQWVRFGVISNIIGTGLVRSNAEQSPNKEYSYFKMNNIGNFSGECDFSEMTKIDASIIEVEKYKVEENDFLFNTRNSRELVGKTAVVPQIDRTVILNNNILKIRFFDLMDPWYINYYFISDLGRRQLNAFITNTTNVAAIYQKQLVTLLVPIPPLEEQHRIVKEIKRFDPFLIKLKESISV